MLNNHIVNQIILERQKQSRYKLNLYALIDGLEYERLFRDEIVESEGVAPLFIQPNNQDFAFAGPWILNVSQLSDDLKSQIIKLEQTYPSVSWIMSSLSFNYLLNHLERKLHLTLEDNRYALLRYYDPRVLNRLPSVFTPEQFKLFTLQINEWIFYLNNHYYSLMTGRLS